MGVSINDPLWKRVLKWVATVALVTALSVLGTVMLLEWMVGCGETYVDAKGDRHEYSCLFIR
jgi:hypothetical protein